MTEEEARSWLATRVSRETFCRLERLVALVLAENERQNLISRQTEATIWVRHIVDSVQLVELSPPSVSSYIDLGSGAGFPGVVLSLVTGWQTRLVEVRSLRAAFLRSPVEHLSIEHCHIIQADAARLDLPSQDLISARAFAPLQRTIELGRHLAHENTRWLLPKGRSAQSELEAAESSWQGAFRLVPSVTDAEAQIIILDGVPKVRSKRSGR